MKLYSAEYTMKKLAVFIPLLIGILILVRGLMPARYDHAFDVEQFGSLPALSGGRLKPLDTTARTKLLLLRGKQSFYGLDGRKRSAVEWLMDVSMRPEVADSYAVFRIDHADWLGIFEEQQGDKKYYSFNELRPHLEDLQRQGGLVNPEAQLRTPYERAILKLLDALNEYIRLTHSLHPPAGVGAVEQEYSMYAGTIAPGLEAMRLRESGEKHDRMVLDRFLVFAQRYRTASEAASLFIIPPEDAAGNAKDWSSIGQSLVDTIRNGEIDAVAMSYARLTDAYRAQDAEAFNRALAALKGRLAERHVQGAGKIGFEQFFNRFEPFYLSSVIYVLVFLAACFSWLFWPKTLGRGAYFLMILTFVVHTFGLIARMYIQGRPPVTNLYSSAIFVGWIAVGLSIVLERIHKNGIGSAVAGLAGFSTLIIAHNLGTGGDTLEMMRAVLDSNFWLATHVVTITIGYAATFLSGFLAFIYIVRGLLTRGLDDKTARSLTGMVYGIACFALLFSFVGTVLGGIWADQSWGRFWGWDPKENGALMIVLWNAIVLHSRWGRLVQRQGFMALAIAGNIVTAWSWFGTNMLGVGLHSYGFMDSAFLWLMAFVASQLILILCAALPPNCWRSPHAPGRL